MDNKIWTKGYFEKEFEKSDPWNFFSSEYEQKKYERQIAFIKDRKPYAEKILEIGCAEGAHTKMIVETFSNAEIIGVDISHKAIQKAKSHVKSDRIKFLEADILDYIDNIPNRYFDVIFWSESVYYIGDRLSVRETFEFFEKIISKLEKRGILCMANIINQHNAPETPLTKKPIMDCYFSIISNLTKLVHISTYLEHKKESGRDYEYQIWIFENNK